MPPPAPFTVQVPDDSDWSPTGAGLPMSPHDQPAGQGEAEAGRANVTVGAPIVTAEAEALAEVPWEPELTASPARLAAGSARVALLPGTSVNVAPSVEVAAWKLSPTR